MRKPFIAVLCVALAGAVWLFVGGEFDAPTHRPSAPAAPRSTLPRPTAPATGDAGTSPASFSRDAIVQVAVEPTADAFLASLTPARCAGRVVDPAGTPLRDAQIFITPVGDERGSPTVAGDDGSYASGDLAPGEYVIVAERDGYVATACAQRFLELMPDESFAVEDLVLARPVTLRGRVVDDDGVAVAGALVDARFEDRMFDRGEWFSSQDPDLETTSGADGSFVFDVAPHRPWRLTAMADGAFTAKHSVDEATAKQDVTLVLPRARTLEFAIAAAATGAPLLQFQCKPVTVGPRAASMRLIEVGLDGADPTTRGTDVLAPGRMRVVVRIDDAVSFTFRADDYVYFDTGSIKSDTVGGAPMSVRLVRDTEPRLWIRARDDADRPVAGRRLILTSRSEGGCGGGGDPHGFNLSADDTDADGMASFVVGATGPYQVRVDDRSLPASRTDWIVFDESAADRVHELRITSPAHVRGRVTLRGAPVAGAAQLQFIRDDFFVASSRTAADGSFVSPPLAPGLYRLRPWDPYLSPQPDVRAAEFAVSAGDDLTRDVDLAEFDQGVVTGHVSSLGSPLPGLSIEVDTGGNAMTAADGTFVLAGARVGPATAKITRGSRRLAARAIEIALGTITRLDLELKISSVSGHVVEANGGAALSAATIVLTPVSSALAYDAPNPLYAMNYTTESGPDGAWRVPTIESGRYVLVARGNTVELAPLARIIQIGEQPARIDVAVPLAAGVRVRLPDSARAEGVSAYIEATRVDAPWYSVNNDIPDMQDEGSIVLGQLAPGTWIVRLHVEPVDGPSAVHRDFGTITLEAAEMRVLDATK